MNNDEICLNRFNSKLNSINDIDPEIKNKLATKASKLIDDVQTLGKSQPTHSLVELFAELPHIISNEFNQFNINHNNKKFIPTPPPLPLSTERIQQLHGKGRLLGGVKKAGKSSGKKGTKQKSKPKPKAQGKVRARAKIKPPSAVKTLGKSKKSKKKAAHSESENEQSENEPPRTTQSQDETYDASSENEPHSDEEKDSETAKKCMSV